jgi:prepilin-type N-terminal cleavage/methylation domain-containing protein
MRRIDGERVGAPLRSARLDVAPIYFARGQWLRARARGFTLAELIVTMTLLGILAALVFGALAANVRLARLLAQRIVEADAVRTATTVLGGELRRASARDIAAVGFDSIALRAFRGIAVACGGASNGVLVHFRGDRMAEPTKDSAIWIGASGRPTSIAIDGVQPASSTSCVGVEAGAVQLWRTSPQVGGRGVLLLFERGTYHLSGGALRYRLGAAGRQPLTADLFTHPASHFERAGTDAIAFLLAVSGTTGAPVFSAVHYPVTPADSL